MPERLELAAVVIPALDPGEELVAYTAALLSSGFRRIIVVNDGSREEALPVFRRVEQLGCHILTHPVNRGKGQALKTAFRYILSQPDWAKLNGVVTVDADGQHGVSDVLRVAGELESDRRELILGTRNMRGENVPLRSRIGSRMANFGFHALYGVRVEDSQTGLRGIPPIEFDPDLRRMRMIIAQFLMLTGCEHQQRRQKIK